MLRQFPLIKKFNFILYKWLIIRNNQHIFNKKIIIIGNSSAELKIPQLPCRICGDLDGIDYWDWEKEDIIETNQSQIGYLITKYLKRGCAIRLNSEIRKSSKNLGAYYKLIGGTLYVNIIDMNNEEEVAATFNKEKIITYLKEKDLEEKKTLAMEDNGGVISASCKPIPRKDLLLTRLYEAYYSKRRGGGYKILEDDEQ